jgi:hypothetical protein
MPSVVLLQDQDWVRQPVRLKYLHDEAGYEEPGNLLTNGFPFLFCKAPQRLLDQLGIWPNIE